MTAGTVDGSCHCGAVRYTARLDLGAPTLRCNCSICTKSRAWLAPVPASDFQLGRGEDTLTEYRFGKRAITHCFCARCGVKTHGRVDGDAGPGALIALCVATLDLTPAQLAAIPIAYIDGRHDKFDSRPDVISFL